MPSAPKWLFDVVDRLWPKLPIMEVSDTQLLSPRVKRISFTGDLTDVVSKPGSFIDFRVNDTEARRYTVSAIDVKQGVIECVAHLHGNGPGSQYMNELQIGDQLQMNQPRPYNYYQESIPKYIIFGDETSLGLACSLQPILKENKQLFQFYFELDEENRWVPNLLKLENYTLFPKDGSFRNEEWVSTLPLFQKIDWYDAHFILTGNAKSAQTFRKVIKKNSSSKVNLHGYWLEGKKGL